MDAKWESLLIGDQEHKIQPTLQYVAEAYKRLLPTDDTRYILVGGTNGKGTVSGALWRLLCLTGKRCGLFTSPHLVHFKERFQISEGNLDDQELQDNLRKMKTLLPAQIYRKLSFFERTTILALLTFKKHNCNTVVLEVGLGGEWDATNCVEPEFSILSTVDFDHQSWLGDTLYEIASTKVGIARKRKPLLVGESYSENHKPEVARALSVAQQKIGYTPLSLKELSDPPAWLNQFNKTWQHNFEIAYSAFGHLEGNCSQLDTLHHFYHSQRYWPYSFMGRWQKIRILSGSQKFHLTLDVCHNPQGVTAFVKNLPPTQGGRILLLSILSNKDIETMLEILQPHFTHIIPYRISHQRSWQQNPRQGSLKLYDSLHDAWKITKQKLRTSAIPLDLYAGGSVAAAGELLQYFSAMREHSFFDPLDGIDPTL